MWLMVLVVGLGGVAAVVLVSFMQWRKARRREHERRWREHHEWQEHGDRDSR